MIAKSAQVPWTYFWFRSPGGSLANAMTVIVTVVDKMLVCELYVCTCVDFSYCSIISRFLDSHNSTPFWL